MDEKTVAEDIYLELYEYVSDKAEYLQPGGDVQLLLPEAAAAGIVALILVPFLKGFFEQLGKDLAQTIAKSAHREKAESDSEAVVGELAKNLQAIKNGREKFPEARQVIYYELLELGISDANSRIIAKRSVEIIQERSERNEG